MSFLSEYRNTQNPYQTHFCPGCGHGSLLKNVDEALRDFGKAANAIWVSPVGCGGLTDSYLDMPHVLSAHGRASAVATAVKRLQPESIVIVSQGDGDLASIGIAEAIHAANRGEDLCVFFVNNANFAMTGGQMAPTTILGQKTSTTRQGRIEAEHGAPIKMCELMNTLEGPAFIARVAFGSVANMREAKRVIRKAVQNQIEHRGYSFVEILSPCPSNWHCSALEARDRVDNWMTQTYPLGIFRDLDRSEIMAQRACPTEFDAETAQQVLMQLTESVGGVARTGLTEPPIALRAFSSAQEATAPCTARILTAGFGGQGVLTLGKVLAHLALDSGLNATWMPSYGPEMRGGVCRCHVQVSNTDIACPVVDTPDILYAFNQPSFDTFAPTIAPNGLVIYDADMVTPRAADPRYIGLNATTLAQAANQPKGANLIMLLHGLLHTHLASSPDACIDAISAAMKRDCSWLRDIL